MSLLTRFPRTVADYSLGTAVVMAHLALAGWMERRAREAPRRAIPNKEMVPRASPSGPAQPPDATERLTESPTHWRAFD